MVSIFPSCLPSQIPEVIQNPQDGICGGDTASNIRDDQNALPYWGEIQFNPRKQEIALLPSCASWKAFLANLCLGWSPNHLSLPHQLWMFCGMCLV